MRLKEKFKEFLDSEKISDKKLSALQDVPFLISNESAYYYHWQTKAVQLLEAHRIRIEKLQNELAESTQLASKLNLDSLLPATKNRLGLLLQSLEHNYGYYQRLLSPLMKVKLSTSGRSLLGAIPSHQSLTLYQSNLFRDWSWQATENEDCLAAVAKVLPSAWAPKSLLVLGAGACRLSLDIHKKWNLPYTLATDINPLLLMIAKEVLEARSVTLYDQRMASLETKSAVCLNELSCDNELRAAAAKGFELAIADFQNLPFKSHLFEAVLTPWFVDIIPNAFEDTSYRINRLLKMGGDWVQFGPLGFMNADEKLKFTKEEIEESLSRSGFKIIESQMTWIPYLEDPSASQKRQEKVFIFRAQKVSELAERDLQKSFVADWLMTHSLPIPLMPEMVPHKALARINADVFFTIDGQKTIDDLAHLMSGSYKITEDEARINIVSLLTHFYEGNQRRLK